jgi:hypothetical protein
MICGLTAYLVRPSLMLRLLSDSSGFSPQQTLGLTCLCPRRGLLAQTCMACMGRSMSPAPATTLDLATRPALGLIPTTCSTFKGARVTAAAAHLLSWVTRGLWWLPLARQLPRLQLPLPPQQARRQQAPHPPPRLQSLPIPPRPNRQVQPQSRQQRPKTTPPQCRKRCSREACAFLVWWSPLWSCLCSVLVPESRYLYMIEPREPLCKDHLRRDGKCTCGSQRSAKRNE